MILLERRANNLHTRTYVCVLWHGDTHKLVTARPACGKQTSNDENVEEDGGQWTNHVERQLGRPDEHVDDCRHRSLVTVSMVVRVDVAVE